MTSGEDDIEVNGPLSEQLQVQDGEAQADINVAHGDIHSVAVAEQLRQQDYHIASIASKVVIRQLPSQGLSFQLWPAATTLVTLLDGHRSHPATSPLSALLTAQLGRPLRILELGSGTGLVGISASAILGAHVTVTDLPHVLPNLRFNAEANSSVLALHGGSVDVAALSWGDIEDMKVIGGEYDLVLGSDVVYHDHLYDPLLQTLRFFLLGGEKRRMVFVMAHLRRWKKESTFFKRAKKHFDVDVIHADAPSNGARVGVQVYRFAAKRNKSAPRS
ncbi:hypothetical protein RJ640_011121 [Escallonia rubra]|uniref:Protein N-lysine methyltransferase METTL21A n=1 Tax=Escallonia rubra TaxID=112253 RepID=A0AA88RFS8_9ASTE|nr:hypothetical protein RJ640_011121 [Escallonia rubra]